MEQNTRPITRQLAIVVVILTSVAVFSLGIRQARRSDHQAEPIEGFVTSDGGQSGLEDRPRPEQLLGLDALDLSKRERDDSGSSGEAVPITKPLKAEGSKGLQKISLGDGEDLYITADGQLWSVSRQPDGSIVKMQVHIDETTGEMTIMNIGGGKSDGSQGLQKISIGDNEDLYITAEGQLWSVSKQPDGSVTKMQVQIDETTGEMTVVDIADSSDGGK